MIFFVLGFEKVEKNIRAQVVVAICSATRSRSDWNSLKTVSLTKLLVPSIVRTISMLERSIYAFRLYLAADDDDDFWLKYHRHIRTPVWLPVFFRFYTTPKNTIPFNFMMQDAYDAGVDYFVRVNDDTEFWSRNWVSEAISHLASYDPPNVGMVGPTSYVGEIGALNQGKGRSRLRQDHKKMMTHDMVHRTHLDIFGYYYPRVFANWYVDTWISKVYGPSRSMMLANWTVKHHRHVHGTRYKPHRNDTRVLKSQLDQGAHLLEFWLHRNMIPVSIGERSSEPRPCLGRCTLASEQQQRSFDNDSVANRDDIGVLRKRKTDSNPMFERTIGKLRPTFQFMQRTSMFVAYDQSNKVIDWLKKVFARAKYFEEVFIR